MKQDPKDPRIKQQEDGTNKDLNLVNTDTSLLNNERSRQMDASTMNDPASGEAVKDNMEQSSLRRDEIYPEYGGAAEPGLETSE